MSPSFDRRLLLGGVLVAGIIVLGAGWAALGPSEDTPAASRYVEGVVGEPERINPLLDDRNPVDADLVALIFSGLTRVGPDGTPEPDLASRWEITPDGRTYTFHLRAALFWHDGRQLDSADVAFTVGLIQAPGFKGSSDLATRWSGVQTLVVDDRTVIFHLPFPSASFLVQASLGILPEHALRGVDVAGLGTSSFNRAPVGSGPYRLTSLTSRRATLEANASYHRGAPAIGELELRLFPSEAALANALARHEVDGALLEESASDVAEALIADRWPRSLSLQVGGYPVLYMNNGRPPLDDPATRRAIAGTLDREALGDLMGGAPGDGPIVPGSWAYSSAAGVTVNPGTLFHQADWIIGSDGLRRRGGEVLRLEIATNDDPDREALARAVAEQLSDAGVDATIVLESASEVFRRRVEARDYQLLLIGWDQGADPDLYGGWHTSQIGAGGRNIAGYNDSESDALLEAARGTVDVTERRDLYARFLERFGEQAPAVVLVYPERRYLLPAELEGVGEGVLFSPELRFRDVHLWRLTGSEG